jgi:hypothetical protein
MDIREWKKHLQRGNLKNSFNWNSLEDVIYNYSTPLSDILRAYNSVLLDVVSTKDDVQISSDYMREVIKYYYDQKLINDKNEIREFINENIMLLSDFKLDNIYVVDCWGVLFSHLLDYSVVSVFDLNLPDAESDDQLKCIFDVIINGSNVKYDDYFKIKIVEKNAELFEAMYTDSKK